MICRHFVKSFQEEPENYQTFKTICSKNNLDVGKTLNKFIRRFIKENGEKVVDHG